MLPVPSGKLDRGAYSLEALRTESILLNRPVDFFRVGADEVLDCRQTIGEARVVLVISSTYVAMMARGWIPFNMPADPSPGGELTAWQIAGALFTGLIVTVLVLAISFYIVNIFFLGENSHDDTR